MSWTLTRREAYAPVQVESLARQVHTPGHLRGLDLIPSTEFVLPLRTFEELSTAMTLGSPEDLLEVSVLEWLDFLDETHWKDLPRSDQKLLAKRTWAAAGRTPLLTEVLVLQIALHVCLGTPRMSGVLLALPDRAPPIDTDRWIALRALVEKDSTKLAWTSWKVGLPPSAALRSLRLPLPLKADLEGVQTACVRLFLKHATSVPAKWDRWLTGVLFQGGTELVEMVIQGLPIDEIGNHEPIREWILERYSPNFEGTWWSDLSTASQMRLKEWTGSIFFEDFKAIIDTMIRHRDRLGLNDTEVNQLQGRVWFWENYRARFRRLRVLLPQKTVDILKNKLQLRQGEIEVLGPEANTEICIFDIDKFVVVEVFRGAGELRLFQGTTADHLLEKMHIGLSDIRYLMPLQIHDHRYYWQTSLVKMLMSCSIEPDPDTKSFRVPSRDSRDGFRIRYRKGKGLEETNPKWLDERKRSWSKWIGQYVKDKGGSISLHELIQTTTWNQAALLEMLRMSRDLQPSTGAEAVWVFKRAPEQKSPHKSRKPGGGEFVVSGRLDHRKGNAFAFIKNTGSSDVFVPPYVLQGSGLKNGAKVKARAVKSKKGPRAVEISLSGWGK